LGHDDEAAGPKVIDAEFEVVDDPRRLPALPEPRKRARIPWTKWILPAFGLVFLGLIYLGPQSHFDPATAVPPLPVPAANLEPANGVGWHHVEKTRGQVLYDYVSAHRVWAAAALFVAISFVTGLWQGLRGQR
jgi:hypothetical protein